jgi:hypothetical protein
MVRVEEETQRSESVLKKFEEVVRNLLNEGGWLLE